MIIRMFDDGREDDVVAMGVGCQLPHMDVLIVVFHFLSWVSCFQYMYACFFSQGRERTVGAVG